MWPFSLAWRKGTYVRLNPISRPKKGFCLSILKWGSMLGAIAIIVFFSVCKLQLNMRVYVRQWISHEELRYYEPLHGCFDNIPSDSPYYAQGHSTFKYEITPGLQLNEGWDCYDFANTIQPVGEPTEHTIYHTYWRADLLEMGDKQRSTFRSFFATQNLNHSTVYLWSNSELSSPILTEIKSHFGDRLQVFVFNANELAKDTPLQDFPYLTLKDSYAYLDGDIVRLLALYKYGGMWFDMDSLFIRDMQPLFEREWVGQWDCFLPETCPFNGAFMRFRKDSPYVCEMLADVATGALPRKGSTDWGSYMYYRVYRRLMANGKRPFDIIPWCFTDSVSCHPSNSMPQAFDEAKFSTERLMQVFAFHWHNKWNKKPGSVFRFLDNLHKTNVGW